MIREAQRREAAERVLRRRSAVACAFLGRYFARYLARNFHAVRIAPDGAPPRVDGPLLVFSNHPSWWEPVIYVALHTSLFGDRMGFGPMERGALTKYRVLERLGVFGVDLDSQAGARDFLVTATHLLGAPDRVLWLAAQGRFADVRERPLDLRAGAAHLARRVPGLQLVPLAIELAFWDERYPEIFLRFGAPLRAGDDFEAGLTATMDALADDVRARDPSRFTLLQTGRAGVGGVYDGLRRLRAWTQGRRFQAGHR